MIKLKLKRKITAFSFLFLLFVSISYSLESCETSVLNTDDIPCNLLFPFNETDLNCNDYSISIYQEDTVLYTVSLSNYSPNFMCSAIFNSTTIGSYTGQLSTGDTADWVVEGGTKMIWLIYLAIALFLAIFVISIWQTDANMGAISAFGFMTVGLFMFLMHNNYITIEGFTLPNNLVTAALAIITFGFGCLILGNCMEAWFEPMNSWR